METETRYTEREVKLKVDLHYEPPDLRGIVGGTERLPEQTFRTSYFDTPDRRLWQRGIELRHRTKTETEIGKWTVKLPHPGRRPALSRTEISWSGSDEIIPSEALDVLRGVLHRARPERVVDMESIRKRLILRDSAGSPLGEFDDDVVTVKSGGRQGLRFRQLELEFGIDDVPTEPDPVMVDEVLGALQSAGAQLDDEPKFAKSLGLNTPAPPTSIGVSGTSGHNVRDIVELAITHGLDRLLDNDYRLRLDPLDPPTHAVHQARVAARRLRSDVKTFGPLLDPAWRKHTVSELRWLGQALGEVRDIDVLDASLLADIEQLDVPVASSAVLRSALTEERRSASRELAETMNSERYMRLVGRLHAAAHAAPFSEADRSSSDTSRCLQSEGATNDLLSELVGRQWKSLRRAVRKAGPHPTDEQLHRIRIRSKQLRYAAEAAVPVAGQEAQRIAAASEKLQVVLGTHHDAVAAEARLRRVPEHQTAALSYAAGQLSVLQRWRQQKFRKQWKRRWARLKRTKTLRWLS